MTVLLCCIALLVGGALGAAWRRAATAHYEALWRYSMETNRRALARLHQYDYPEQYGRPSESVRREGPTVARTLEELMRGEP